MSDTRRIPFITLSEYIPRAWVTLSGCNFRCRGCFSLAKAEVGEPLTVIDVAALVAKAAEEVYGEELQEVLITGGEPALDRDHLVRLVIAMKGLAKEVVVQSNASLLSPSFLDELLEAGMGGLIVDLKAMDDSTHEWYTGRSNRPVLENIAYACKRIPMVVNTLLIPGVVEADEIVEMACFLRSCHPLDLELRINPFRADLSPEKISRTPSDAELTEAEERCRAHYERTFSSRSCLRESRGAGSRTWITVFPDGRMERRGVQNYRSSNHQLFQGG